MKKKVIVRLRCRQRRGTWRIWVCPSNRKCRTSDSNSRCPNSKSRRAICRTSRKRNALWRMDSIRQRPPHPTTTIKCQTGQWLFKLILIIDSIPAIPSFYGLCPFFANSTMKYCDRERHRQLIGCYLHPRSIDSNAFIDQTIREDKFLNDVIKLPLLRRLGKR